MAKIGQHHSENRPLSLKPGQHQAADEREAIEIAAKEFNQHAKKLMAVERR
jgi:hypothetical protein